MRGGVLDMGAAAASRHPRTALSTQPLSCTTLPTPAGMAPGMGEVGNQSLPHGSLSSPSPLQNYNKTKNQIQPCRRGSGHGDAAAGDGRRDERDPATAAGQAGRVHGRPRGGGAHLWWVLLLCGGVWGGGGCLCVCGWSGLQVWDQRVGRVVEELIFGGRGWGMGVLCIGGGAFDMEGWSCGGGVHVVRVVMMFSVSVCLKGGLDVWMAAHNNV